MAHSLTADENQSGGRRSLRDWGGWHYLPGIAFLVIGVLALAEPPLASLAAAFYVGAMLLVAGAFMFVGGIANISHRGGWISAVLGVLGFLAGLFVLNNPIATAISLVWLMGGWLIVSGIMELAIGFNIPVGRGWLVLVSLVNIILGAFVLFMRPAAAFAFLGYFMGISLIFHGLWSLIFTADLKRERDAAASKAD